MPALRGFRKLISLVEQAGTSVLLEDVAVPVQNLAKLCNGINEMFEKFDYHDGSAFGHALEGNLHLVFTQVAYPTLVARNRMSTRGSGLLGWPCLWR